MDSAKHPKDEEKEHPAKEGEESVEGLEEPDLLGDTPEESAEIEPQKPTY